MVKENMNFLSEMDPEVGEAVKAEYHRQQRGLELIASENVVSKAVLAANSTVLTNKYAEGYPGKRYYGGCECVDVVENIAIERAKKLFGANFANVQPHSGAQANSAVYFKILEHGDKVLGMSLAHGGHLTHGSPVNLSGKYYQFEAYGVSPETGRIDYDALEEKAMSYRPKLIVAGASAYPRIIDFERISDHGMNLKDSAKEMKEKEMQFSSKAEKELGIFFDAVKEILNLSIDAFETNNTDEAARVEPLEEVIDDINTVVKANHIRRLQKGKCTIEQGFVLSDISMNLERVSDHCSNIAVSVIEEQEKQTASHAYLHSLKKNDEFSFQLQQNLSRYVLPAETAEDQPAE